MAPTMANLPTRREVDEADFLGVIVLTEFVLDLFAI